MQTWLLAVFASGRQESAKADCHSRRDILNPPGRVTQRDGRDFAFDTPRTSRLDLFRLMPDHTFDDRHTSGGIT